MWVRKDNAGDLDNQNVVLYRETTQLMARIEGTFLFNMIFGWEQALTESELRKEIDELNAEISRVTWIMEGIFYDLKAS